MTEILYVRNLKKKMIHLQITFELLYIGDLARTVKNTCLSIFILTL